jgi:PIN domain nuclease of toxin-antitoxin system
VAAKTFLDTHVALWVFSGRTSLLSQRARRRLERDALFVSPMVILEIDLLREIGRVHEAGDTIVKDLELRLGLQVSTAAFREVIVLAGSQSWTLDPFDRIIVAQASLEGATLLTKDGSMRDHYSRAIW